MGSLNGFSLDFYLLQKDIWTEEDERIALEAQKKFGWFKEPRQINLDEKEYPD